MGGGPHFDTPRTAGGMGLWRSARKTKTPLLGRDSNRQRQKVKAAQKQRRNKPGGLIQAYEERGEFVGWRLHMTASTVIHL